jgi:hypothetical protein
MLIPLQDISQAKAILWTEQPSPLVIFHNDPAHEDSKNALSAIRRLMTEHPGADYYHLNARTHPEVSHFVRQALKISDHIPHAIILQDGKTCLFAGDAFRADDIHHILNNSE